MAEVVDVRTIGYQPVEEEELPVKGFLFREKRLAGVYTRGAFIPVMYDTPVELDRDILSGRSRPRMVLRMYRTEGGELYDVVLISGLESWHVASFVDGGYPPPEESS
ncbi:MAG: hypothetical protein GXO14_00030 [Thermococci archaeon]|nr:hypothetical protein [Thermococci archaeon]